MNYADLMAKNPHITRNAPVDVLMADQEHLVQKHHTQQVENNKKRNLRMTPAQKMAAEEQSEWEKQELLDDLNELLYMLHDKGKLILEWEQEPTK